MSVPAAGVTTILRPAGEPAGGGHGADGARISRTIAHRRIVVTECAAGECAAGECAADPGAGVLVAEPASLSGRARSSGSLSELIA